MATQKNKTKNGMIVLSIIFAILLILLFLAYSSNAHLTKSHYDLNFKNLPKNFDGYKILQLSDLHVKEFGDENSKLIKAIEKEDPDIIVTTGDMINSTDTPDKFEMPAKLLTDLSSKYDTYYIDGNHETAMDIFNSENYNKWMTLVKDSGAVILNNDNTIIKKGNSSINLYGLWYNGRYYNDMSDENAEKYFLDVEHIQKLIGTSNTNSFNLLLTHNPVYFDVYKDWGADLTLAGHMHGGVIRIPFKGGLISPERVYWPEYDAGEFSNGESKMIVNRGLGNGNSGYRFLNWPDISVITLYSN